MNRRRIHRLIEIYFESCNMLDIDCMFLALHPRLVFKNISDGNIDLVTNGLLEIKAHARMALRYFRDYNQTVKELIIIDNCAEAIINLDVLLPADLPNGKKAGERLVLEGKSIFKFEDGLIIQIENYSTLQMPVFTS
jgi:hypothetical protein